MMSWEDGIFLPEPAGEIPTDKQSFDYDPAMYDEPFGEVPGISLDYLFQNYKL